jgi:predicted TIM-barrel fold metal-dependent hydrolase
MSREAPVIDFHCHAGMGDRLTDPAFTRADLGSYLRRARAAGIDRTVVFPTLNDNCARANARLFRIVSRLPHRLTGFAFVNTKRDQGRIGEMIKTAVERYGFRGVKVHGHQGLLTREVCEAARKFRIPILVDVFNKPWHMDLSASEYPDVQFVVAHLGSYADDWRIQQAVIDLMVRYPNIHADTSGVRRFSMIEQAIDRVGPRRVIFGSDGPWLHPGLELHKIRLLKLNSSDERLVIGGNAARLLCQSTVKRTLSARFGTLSLDCPYIKSRA